MVNPAISRERETVDQVGGWSCTICGENMPASRRSFAVVQSRLEDKVRIFHREDMAGPRGVQGACCSAHVRELVIHWMVTGSLDYPFADARSKHKLAVQSPTRSPGGQGAFDSLAVPIGELAIDRDSVSRILSENPAWLEVILGELHDALERSIETRPAVIALADLPENLVHHM